MSNNLYSIKQGEKYDISICIRDRDNDTPIDLTNAVIHFQLKDELKDEFFVVDKTITLNSDPFTDGRIVDPTEGRFTTRFTDEDYEKLVPERIYFLIITWSIPDKDFSKVVSSNCGENFLFKVCYP